MSTNSREQRDDPVRPGGDGLSAAGPAPPGDRSYADRASHSEDLDAGAPELRVQEFRRLNHRALAFLAAIVLLLVALSAVLYRSATAPRAAVTPRSDTLVVPELPKAVAAPAAPAGRAAAVDPPPQPPPPAVAIPPVPPIPVLPSVAQREPGLIERRGMPIAGNSLTTAADPDGLSAPDVRPTPAGQSHATSARALQHRDALLLRGTFIRCILQTRIITDIPGYTACVVSEPVYSFDGARLLLPRGSKVFGAYDQGPVGERVAVVWDRIVTPGGVDVDMASPGVDNLGGAGYPGDLDSHWRSRITSAVLMSLMSDAFLYEGAKHGPKSNAIGQGGVVLQEPYQSNTAETLQNLANQAVRRSANRQPTLTINQGSTVSIYVAKDVDFSDVVSRR